MMIFSVHFVIITIVAVVSFNGCVHFVQSDASIDIPLKKTNDLIFPSAIIDAIVGADIYFKIMQPVADQTDCFYRRTGGQNVNIQTPNESHYESWQSEKCGLIIRKIRKSDQGRWILTSTHQNKVFTRSKVMIKVREEMQMPTEVFLKPQTPIKLPEPPSYCYVVRPAETTTSTFPQHKKCDLPESPNEADATGKWNVMVGFKGKTNEVSFDVSLMPMVEEIQTFTEMDTKTDSLNLQCKLINTKKTMTFCRFLRLSDNNGYNLENGFGDTKYRYIGQGLEHNECGIAIQNPTANDKSMWKCFMGVEEAEDIQPGGIEKPNRKIITTVGAIVSGGIESHHIEGEIETDNVYGLKDMPVNLLCKSKSPTDYCWFRDPGGNKISVSDRKPKESNEVFRYYGAGIKLGDCGLTIMKATHNDSGTWSCHMGSAHATIIDRMKEINVRIADTSLVSTSLFRDGQIGASLIIDCKSIPSHVPLDYCRFVLPDGIGFSLSEQTTIHKPFMNNYYFNPNREMSAGFCSLIVKKVERSHSGQWTCAARLTGRDTESYDEFRVNVLDADDVSVAAISGISFAISFGASLMVVLMFIAYRKYQTRRIRRETALTTVSYITSADRVSIHSDNSSNASNVGIIELTELQTTRQTEQY